MRRTSAKRASKAFPSLSPVKTTGKVVVTVAPSPLNPERGILMVMASPAITKVLASLATELGAVGDPSIPAKTGAKALVLLTSLTQILRTCTNGSSGF